MDIIVPFHFNRHVKADLTVKRLLIGLSKISIQKKPDGITMYRCAHRNHAIPNSLGFREPCQNSFRVTPLSHPAWRLALRKE